MTDLEPDYTAHIQSVRLASWLVALWWGLLLVPTLYVIASARMSAPADYQGFAVFPALMFSVLPFVLGIPAGVALRLYVRRLAGEVYHPKVSALQRNSEVLLLAGIGATVLMPVLALTSF